MTRFAGDLNWVGFDGGAYFRVSEVAGWEPQNYGGVDYTRVFLVSGLTADVQMHHEDFTDAFVAYLKDSGFTL